MDKMKMHSPNKVDENIEKIGKLFPDCVTERKNEKGETEYGIDFDMLRQELSDVVIEGNEERYQFTWPDKKKSILLANAPIAKTLRPCPEESVDFDNTENLYIEGDNLDVLKLLQETYLGKVKMIYIDPPYNTGNDFVYEDDFAQNTNEYLANSGQYDEEGNRLVKNLDSNGRFHTDWLNMIYPRLKLAKDLLTDDGVIFISIDDNEQANLKKMCDEIFGSQNKIGLIANVNNPKGRSDDKYVATSHEYILIYAKCRDSLDWYGFEPTEEVTRRYNKVDEFGNKYREIDLRKTGDHDLREDRPNLFYYFHYNKQTGVFYPSRESDTPDGYMLIMPLREDGKQGRWRWGLENAIEKKGQLIPKYMPTRKMWGIMVKDYLEGRKSLKPVSSWTFKDVNSERGTEQFIELGFEKTTFANPKPIGTIERCLQLATNGNDLIFDFFSGSATTAHAVMQLNAEDGGNRKFIMVQLPEETDEKSEAYKAGYKNICEIGEERIRRAGEKIRNEKLGMSNEAEEIRNEKLGMSNSEANSSLFTSNSSLNADSSLLTPNLSLDTGFRVLKLDSTNMKNVYYNPAEYDPDLFNNLTDNIKEDRTPEDLLFQVMLDLGILLSSKIEESVIAGKKVLNVADNYLIACFDDDVTDETVKAIAQQKPYYAVFRDSSMESDSVATNFEQIFKTYSPTTIRKVM